MSTKNQRQIIIDFIIKNEWAIHGSDYKHLWLGYMQALYNHLTSLEARWYISKVWKHLYSVVKKEYTHEMILWETKKELIRLREIEKRYNIICNICGIANIPNN